MTSDDSRLALKATEYAKFRKFEIGDQLGAGVDGIVFATSKDTAVKVLKYKQNYERERDVYLRIEKNEIRMIDRFHVPKLISFEDRLWIIEMEIVVRPFILDFAGAYLDQRPPFDEEQFLEWEESRKELFGSDWDTVVSAMAEFRRYGIFLNDVKPGNVTL